MGYSKNPIAIDRMSKFLDLMFDSDAVLEWETPDPNKLTYYLRDAIAAAEKILRTDPENVRMLNYASLKGKFIIRIKGNKVIAAIGSQLFLNHLRQEKNSAKFIGRF